VTFRIAYLPMYDLPSVRSATDALWTAIAGALTRRGVERVPTSLHREEAFGAAWTDPDLLLGQTCGYVLTHALAGRVRLVATPRYRAPGCVDACYSSWIVVRASSAVQHLEQLRGGVAVYNTDDSHSGMNALRTTFAPLAVDGRFFARTEQTGAHHTSLQRVAAGSADVAAIDCVTFALVQRAHPELTSAVRVIGQSPCVPGIPLITRATATDEEVEVLRAALREAWETVDATVKTSLWLDRIDVVPEADYGAIDALEDDAIRRGYPSIA
jgi:ABC-type phosphate/phosphonate transport system substrate-binding protein